MDPQNLRIFSRIMKSRKPPSFQDPAATKEGVTRTLGPDTSPHMPNAHQHMIKLTGGRGDRLSNVNQGAVDGLLGLMTVFPQEDIADPLPELWPQEAILNLLLDDII